MTVTAEQFEAFRSLLRGWSGLQLGGDKRYLVEQRLEPLLAAHGLADAAALLDKLRGGSPTLRTAVIDAMATKETSFFRDGHPFAALRDRLLPELADLAVARRRDGLGPVRVWCAAASTGQEPYTVAMLLAELMAGRRELRPGDVEILATDISQPALDQAAAGRYPERELARGLSDELRTRHFRPAADGDGAEVAEPVRAMVRFRQLNLIEPFAHLGLFHLVLCRNLLIYFDEEDKRRVVGQFARVMARGAPLLLGAVENLMGMEDGFAAERIGETRIYRRR